MKPYRKESLELKWHKHPVFVAFISFILGGLVLNYIQTSVSKENLLREKRIMVLEELAVFSQKISSTYRQYNIYAKIKNDPKTPVSRKLNVQEQIQNSIDKMYSIPRKLELYLLIYFSETNASKMLSKTRF